MKNTCQIHCQCGMWCYSLIQDSSTALNEAVFNGHTEVVTIIVKAHSKSVKKVPWKFHVLYIEMHRYSKHVWNKCYLLLLESSSLHLQDLRGGPKTDKGWGKSWPASRSMCTAYLLMYRSDILDDWSPIYDTYSLKLLCSPNERVFLMIRIALHHWWCMQKLEGLRLW